MNMRHYVHKTDEARRSLFINLGLTSAFKSGTVSSIRCRDFHIKYQGEARPGDSLRIDSAIITLEDATAQICHVMRHRDNRIAATAIETVEHIYLPEDKIFAWPRRVQSAAPHYTATLPAPAKPRNIDGNITHKGPSLDTLKDAGISVLGAGVFNASELDITQRVTMGYFFGRTTSTIGWFRKGWPEFDDPTYHAQGKSGALLEMKAVVHKFPGQGDAYVYAPALTGVNAYTREFIHNILDPVTGENWVSMQASGCKFDLNERKLIRATEEDLVMLRKGITPGVSA